MTIAVTTSITSRFLVALLDGRGCPPDDLLDAVGIDREALSSPDCRMPLTAFRELWARSARFEQDIGLRLVERFPEGQMHLLAHLALRSPTVGEALDTVTRFFDITTHGDRFELQPQDELAWIVYTGAVPDNPWIVEHYFAMASRFIGRSAGRALPIVRMEFAAPPQAPLDAYRERFGVLPDFGAGRNAMGFDRQALQWPLLTHDAYLHSVLEQVVTARQPREKDAPLNPIRRRIATALLRGETPALQQLATDCGMTPALLRKQLTAAGTTFRELLDATRRDLAQQHLRSDLSVTQIAYLLGFSEPAAFQHACRRWFGCSAGELRRQLATTDSPT